MSPQPLPEPRFVLDGHLGKLARYLRLLGFDAVCSAEWTDPELVELSRAQDRVLLTRDVGLLMHGVLTHGYYVRATEPSGAGGRGCRSVRPREEGGCLHEVSGLQRRTGGR